MGLDEARRKKDVYDYIAPFYDFLFYIFVNPIRKVVLNMLSSYTNRKVIDLCCGTGDQLKALQKNGFTDLYGADLSEAMLSVAKKHSKNIKLYHRDVTSTGFTDETFDAVIICFALHEKSISVQEGIIEETFRILKEGGILVVADYKFDNKTVLVSRLVISILERMVGKEHFTNFGEYIKNNGLEKIIHDNRFQLQISKRKMLGGITINQYNRL